LPLTMQVKPWFTPCTLYGAWRLAGDALSSGHTHAPARSRWKKKRGYTVDPDELRRSQTVVRIHVGLQLIQCSANLVLVCWQQLCLSLITHTLLLDSAQTIQSIRGYCNCTGRMQAVGSTAAHVLGSKSVTLPRAASSEALLQQRFRTLCMACSAAAATTTQAAALCSA
jgi:hypothetical protein